MVKWVLSALAVTAVLAVVASAPPPTPSADGGDGSGLSDSRRHHRVSRQVPGLDIFGQISESFQEHMQQKQERVMDVVDQVGKVLGALGDTFGQQIGADGADDGQRAAGGAEKVGEVLTALGDRVKQALGDRPEEGGLDGGQRAAGSGVGQILNAIGERLREAAAGNDEHGDLLEEGVARLVGQDEGLDDRADRAVAQRMGGGGMGMGRGRGRGRGKRALQSAPCYGYRRRPTGGTGTATPAMPAMGNTTTTASMMGLGSSRGRRAVREAED